MIPASDGEGLCDLARTGAKLAKIVNPTASLHEFNPSPRFERANQNKAVRIALHEHVQHPVNPVVEVDVCRASFVSLDKAACARTRKGMRSFIIDCRIGFYLDDDSCAFAPSQFSADKFTRAGEWIALEERRANHLFHWCLFPSAEFSVCSNEGSQLKCA